MQSYSAEMRRDVPAASELGAATLEVATELGLSRSWVRRVKQEFREQGKTAAKTTRTRRGQGGSEALYRRGDPVAGGRVRSAAFRHRRRPFRDTLDHRPMFTHRCF